MGGILTDFSIDVLTKAIRDNLFAWYRYLGRSPGAGWHETPEITWLMTGVPFSFLNAVFHTRIDGHRADQVIEEVLQRFTAGDAEDFSWWIEPDTQPTDLGSRLRNHGFVHTDEPTGMAIDLRQTREDIPLPEGFNILEVDNMETLQAWTDISMIDSKLTDEQRLSWFHLFKGLDPALRLYNYLGMLHGKPAATAELFLGEGVAGIYMVTTVPCIRRRGAGTAMTLHALRQALAMGYRIGILQASPMGRGVYLRIGFKEHRFLSRFIHVR